MNHSNDRRFATRYRIIVIAVALICLFSSLGSSRFWDQDEGFFASTAAEMYANSEWIVPSFNGEMFGHKPPWMYWMMMFGYSLFGVGEFGARFFSAVFGLATAWLTFQLGWRLVNLRTGLIAAVVMPSCLMFGVVSRAATPDVYLVFFSTLALYLFASHGFLRHGDDPNNNSDENLSGVQRMLPDRWSSWVMIYAVLGLAALVKGPIGFLFPMAVIGLFLLVMTPVRSLRPETNRFSRVRERIRPFGPVNFFQTIWRMRPLTAIGMILLIAGPWYLVVDIQTNGAFLAEFFGVHHWQRFASPMDNHSGPVFYYILAILVGVFPWSIYAGAAALEWFQQLRERNQHFPTIVFIGCWVGVYVGIFSLASTKLPNYVLPVYPALAVMVAMFIDSAITRSSRKDLWAARISFAGMVLVGGVLLFGMPMLAYWKFDGQTILERADLVDSVNVLVARLAWIGLPLFAGGLLAIWLVRMNRMKEAFVAASVASITFMLVFWNDAVPFADQYQTPQQMASRFRELTDGKDNVRLAQFGLFRPSMVFYRGGKIDQCNNARDVINFLSSSENESYVVTTSQRYHDMKRLHNRFEIVERQPDFPKQGELLLIRNRTVTADNDSIQRR